MKIKRFHAPHSLEVDHVLEGSECTLIEAKNAQVTDVEISIRVEAKKAALAKKKKEQEEAKAKAKKRFLRKRKRQIQIEEKESSISVDLSKNIIKQAMLGNGFAVDKFNDLLVLSDIVSEDDQSFILEVSPSKFDNIIITFKKTPDTELVFENFVIKVCNNKLRIEKKDFKKPRS